jgi:hypothetical protein
MRPLVQVVIAAFTAGLPTLTVLVSLLINNQRLADLSRQISAQIADLDKRMDQRFAEHRELFRSELYRVEQVMDARLRHLEEHLAR